MKGVALLVVFLGMVSGIAIAQEQMQFEVYKQAYAPGESVQLEIGVNSSVSEVNEGNIRFYASDGQRIAIAPFVDEVDEGRLFVLFDVPIDVENGTYILKVVDVPFRVNGVLQLVTAEQQIRVEEGYPIVALYPGFIKIEQERMTMNVRLMNKQGSTSVQVSAPSFVSHIYNQPQVLNQGATKVFKFNGDTSSLNESVKESITFTYGEKEYKVPLFIRKEAQKSEEAEESIFFVTTVPRLNKTIKQGETVEGPLVLKKRGSKEAAVVMKVTPSLSEGVEVTPAAFIIKANEEKEIRVSINKKKSLLPGVYNGSLIAETTQGEVRFDMVIEVEEEETQEETVTVLEISPDPLESAEEPPKAKEVTVIDFNLTSEKTTSKKESKKGGFLVVTIIMLILLFFVVLIKKKRTRQTSFKQYVATVGKR